MPDEKQFVLMDGNRVRRSLQRMAHQVAEDNRKNLDLYLIGIKKRGFITATTLASYLEGIYGRDIPVSEIDPDETLSGNLFSKLSVQRSYPLVVDDVIFSGKTMFTALNKIYTLHPFHEIHSAVLVDRGHRKFPIQAQFTGIEFPTKLKEHVSVITGDETIQQVVVKGS